MNKTIGKAILNGYSLQITSKVLLGTLLFLIAFSVFARGIYQTNQDFLAQAFDNNVPKSQVIWMKGDVSEKVADILGHRYAGLRIRYWQDDERSAWVLEEIGKTEPITFGIVIADNKVEKVNVLAFRESRGDEIRYPAFTRQFKQAELNDDQLDRQIDGISGATLSVRAMTKVVRLALYLAKNH
jgi:Na+-translocating ferredoxin:NAD+ oxidoreductase RnfG subunit